MKMVKNLEEMNAFGKENVDVAMKSFGALSKSAQAIAAEVADYSKKSFEEGTATAEKMFGVKSVEKAVELQTDYLKRAYGSFVSEAAKLGELYTDLAKQAYQPLESYFAKMTVAK
jgi:hypothetical protein